MASHNRPADLGAEYRQPFKAALDDLRASWTTVVTKWPSVMNACDTQYNLRSSVLTTADGDALLTELDALKDALEEVRLRAGTLRQTTFDWMRFWEGHSTGGDGGGLNYG
jgi:hypothetical protein